MSSTQVNRYNSHLEVDKIKSSPNLKAIQAAERETRVQKAMESTCIPLACECLDNYMYEIHERSSQQLPRILDRIENLYNQIFSPTPGLNTSSVRRPTFLEDDKEIQKFLQKSDKLFIKYQDLCIDEAGHKMPKYFIHKLNLQSEDEEIIKKQFSPAIKVIKEQFLEGEFSTFHRDAALSFIQYFLRIPDRTDSYTFWMLQDLKKANLIDEIN